MAATVGTGFCNGMRPDRRPPTPTTRTAIFKMARNMAIVPPIGEAEQAERSDAVRAALSARGFRRRGRADARNETGRAAGRKPVRADAGSTAIAGRCDGALCGNAVTSVGGSVRATAPDGARWSRGLPMHKCEAKRIDG